jgi:uncharacterized protein
MRSTAIKFFLKVYRYGISPTLHAFAGAGSGCRFTPSCSEYAADAIEYNGILKGTFLVLKRVCRCHPFGSFGYDPVPGTQGQKSKGE